MRATGFRPFFFLAAVWGLCVVGLTALAAAGSPLAGQALPANPFAWHGREMVFGYVPAVMAGFLLTAIPNWTGRLPLAGWRLWLLVGLWFGGRVAGWAGEWTGGACSGPGAAIPPAALVAADLAFLTMLVLVVGRELVAGRNWRNLPVLAGVMVMLLALALWHGSAASGAVPANVGLRLGLAAAAMMIALIGGRIVPSFTTNWLKGRGASGLPRPFGPYDRMVLLATGVALAGWVIVPASASTMGLAALAAGLNIVRLARWRGAATAGEPLLWVLHLGYGWLVLALALIALGAARPEAAPAAIHGLGAGAIATMTLAMMSRATLGHSGSPLTAGPLLTLVFVAVTAAALLRVTAALWPTGPASLVTAAAVAWTLAFMGFLIACGPLLLRLRAVG